MNNLDNVEVLNECRDLVTKRMRSSITKMMNELDDTLLTIAFNKGYEVDEEICYDTIREIILKKDEIKTRFERRYVSLFQESVDQGYSSSDVVSPYSEFNEKKIDEVGVEKTIKKVNSDCRKELLNLDKKIALLLKDTKQEELVNPVKPEFICTVFAEACSGIGAGNEVINLLTGIFDRHATKELQSIYFELNGLLSRRVPTTSTDILDDEKDNEQKVIMIRYQVMSVIEERLRGQEVPDFIRAFLVKHWRLFMEKIYQGQGDNNPIWDKALETAEDLILSVQKVSTDTERKKLNWMLPSLIFRLRNGMRIASVPILEKTRFLNKLKNYHIAILNDKTKTQQGGLEGDQQIEQLVEPDTVDDNSYINSPLKEFFRLQKESKTRTSK